MKHFHLLIFVALFALPACAATSTDQVDELADKLTILTVKAEGISRYSDEGIPAAQLESAIKAVSPKIFEHFRDYSLQYKIEDGHVSVLLCDKEKTHMIAEDIGCSPHLDKKSYNAEKTCKFSLSATEICQILQ